MFLRAFDQLCSTVNIRVGIEIVFSVQQISGSSEPLCVSVCKRENYALSSLSVFKTFLPCKRNNISIVTSSGASKSVFEHNEFPQSYQC